MTAVPAHNIVNLQIILGLQHICLGAAARKSAVNDNFLRAERAARGIIILLEEYLQLIQQGGGDNHTIVEYHIVFPCLCVGARRA